MTHDDRSSTPAGPARSRLAEVANHILARSRGTLEDLTPRLAELSIREQAELLTRLPAGLRSEVIVHAPRPMRLVRALPDLDLYLTLREIGPSDAIAVTALASASQIQHVVDLESWRKDRFDPDRAGAWVAYLLEAGEPALKRFLRTADEDLLALLFSRWLRVQPIELEDDAQIHGHDQTERGDERGLVSPDGGYRFSPTIPEHAPAVQRIAQIMFQEMAARYRRIVWAAVWELPAELEESALHWRRSRLEEHGFPGWEDALSTYAPPAGIRAHPSPPEPSDRDGLHAPRVPLQVLGGRRTWLEALDTLPDPLRERALHETVSLANRLLVADGADTGDPAAHRTALDKAAGLVSVALELRGADSATAVRRVLQDVPMIELFREGHARTIELQRHARSMLREGWAATHPRALELLDSPVRERVASLLLPRPLYFDAADDEDEANPRHFRSGAELAETAAAVEMARVVGEWIVTRIGFDIATPLDRASTHATPEPRLSTFFLTALAWHATRKELVGAPLSRDLLATFLRAVASRRTAAPEAPERALQAMIRDAARRFELSSREIAVLSGYGRACLKTLAEECSMLDPGAPPDSRFISCLLLEI